jgi:nucleoside-diphosphate-sugar epimerase
MVKTALVLGAGGFIGNHLVNSLKKEGFWVRGVDLKHPEYSSSKADEFFIFDLKKPFLVEKIFQTPNQKTILESNSLIKNSFDEVYQLAADMGGAGFIFTGENDADIMHNSALININVCKYAVKYKAKKIFYASSACIYPEHNQLDPENPNCAENTAYPADPDSEYGWEKLFSERLYLSFHKNYNLNIRIARFHNIFGPQGAWVGGREKAPAALCRKVSIADNGGEIKIWGDGSQTRSFLYIDECIRGIRKLMDSECYEPLNIGSEEIVSINELANITMQLANKNLKIKHIQGPVGVKGRNSDNTLIMKKLGWAPNYSLKKGIQKTFLWINEQVNQSKEVKK